MSDKPLKKQKRKSPMCHWWKCQYCGDAIRSRFDHPPWRKHKCGREDWAYAGFGYSANR